MLCSSGIWFVASFLTQWNFIVDCKSNFFTILPKAPKMSKTALQEIMEGDEENAPTLHRSERQRKAKPFALDFEVYLI